MMQWKQFVESRNIENIASQAGLDISGLEINELRMGFDEELEHGKRDKSLNVTNNDPVKTLKIVLAHLKEDPKYYTKLKKAMK